METSVYLAPDADARGIRTLLHKRLFESLEGGEVHRDDVARFERHLV